MLLSSILGVAVIGAIGAASGRNALRQVESERLIEMRESQKRAVQALFREVSNSLIICSGGFGINQATTALTADFAQLNNATISPAQQQSLVDYYDNDMIKPIKQITGDTIDIRAVLPTSNAQKYVQAYYTAPPRANPDALPVLDAGDGSAWSASNARFDFYMRGIVNRFDYRDALLLDMQGNVVYSVRKGPDLGTNILTGPYRESKLREAYQKALASNDVDFVWITDFQQYQPALDTPTAWVVSPIGMNGRFEGVMALPVPVAKINKIMTADKHWDAGGMGPATETYLAGPDDLMRSDSRTFIEDPKDYRRSAIDAGTPPDVVDRAIRLGTAPPWCSRSIPPAFAPPNAARRAWSAPPTTWATGSWKPMPRWPSPTPTCTGRSSRRATTPTRSRRPRQVQQEAGDRGRGNDLRHLRGVDARSRRPRCGRSGASKRAPARSAPATTRSTSRSSRRDEIGDLTAAFNEMSRNLAIKEELLNEQRRENDRLLLSLMPESVLQRYREGEETIAQNHQDVAIIYRRHRRPGRALQRRARGRVGRHRQRPLPAIRFGRRSPWRRTDSHIAQRLSGQLRGGHPAAGQHPSRRRLRPRNRSDHRPIQRRRSVHQLGLRVGVNTGNVVSGLVGRSSLVYDMWGGAVSLAYQMHSGSPQPGVYVSSQVYEAMRDVRQFTPAGTISVGGADQAIYRLPER